MGGPYPYRWIHFWIQAYPPLYTIKGSLEDVLRANSNNQQQDTSCVSQSLFRSFYCVHSCETLSTLRIRICIIHMHTIEAADLI